MNTISFHDALQRRKYRCEIVLKDLKRKGREAEIKEEEEGKKG